MPAWAEISNNVIPVELGKLLAGQYSQPAGVHGRDQDQGGRAGRSVPQGLAAGWGSPRRQPSATDGSGPRHRQQHHGDQGDRLGPGGPRRCRGPRQPAHARPRPRLDGAERRGLVALARRRPARPVPPGRPGPGGGPGDQQPARDGGLPRRARRGAAAGDPVARRALPARHRPVQRQAAAASGFRAITGKTPDPTPAVFSLHWLHALRARALAAHGPHGRRAGLSGLAPDRQARDQLGQRRSARPARPRHDTATARRSWRSSG